MYDDNRRVFITVNDGSRWEVNPGQTVAVFSPPWYINLRCDADVVSDPIEGIEIEGQITYTEDRELFIRRPDGKTWRCEPDMKLTHRGPGTLCPNEAWGHLVEEGVASAAGSA